jgi:hypothetical protein
MRARGGQRGAASLEALVILPFFFIVWGCIFFAHRVMEKRVAVSEVARSCAWDQMSGGCARPPSPRCNFSSGAQLSDEELEGSRAAMVNIESRFTDFVIDFRSMFGPAFRPIFGAERQARVTRPRQMGGGELGVSAAFSEMCNETQGDETVGSVSASAFCSLTGWCP